jgi:hypothetical protein
MSDKPITAFLSVFEQRLGKLKNSIKDEIGKPKKERSKKRLKRFLIEAKDLKRLIKNMKGDEFQRCPHCGEVI